MTNQQNNTSAISILPKGQEERDAFAKVLNDIIDSQYRTI